MTTLPAWLPHDVDDVPPASPGLYIHVPFCLRRCLYCAFYLEPLGKGPLGKRLEDLPQAHRPDFLSALERELKKLPEGFSPKTIYIGGGTPTELTERDLTRLLELIHRYVDCSQVREWSCEANPGTVRDGTFDELREAGVNRLSLGVQSFQRHTLDFLTRFHTAEEARETYSRARKAGFKSVSIDLIFGVPGSGVADWKRDLDDLIECSPDHSTCYILEFEEETGLMKLLDRGFVEHPEEDVVEEQYAMLRERLGAVGYRRYELFAFARKGHTCLHHRNYWAAGDYLGLGPSAHSHWQGERWRNAPSLTKWQSALAKGGDPRIDREKLDPKSKARETLMIGLRRAQGVAPEAFEQQTGCTIRELVGEQIDGLINRELLHEEPSGRIRLTDNGLLLSDMVFREFV